MTSLQGLDAALDMLESRFGAVTSLVHAAAVQGPIGEITTVDPDEWLNAIRINLFGTFLAVRQTCARMKARGGRIVLFSGGGAAAPFPNYTAYACSKTGVVRFAETARRKSGSLRNRGQRARTGTRGNTHARTDAGGGQKRPSLNPCPRRLEQKLPRFCFRIPRRESRGKCWPPGTTGGVIGRSM